MQAGGRGVQVRVNGLKSPGVASEPLAHRAPNGARKRQIPGLGPALSGHTRPIQGLARARGQEVFDSTEDETPSLESTFVLIPLIDSA